MSEATSTPTPLPAALALRPPATPDQSPLWLAEAITWAHEHGATDVHLFPGEQEGQLWVRLDGELRIAARYPMACHARMVARLKVLGRCTDYAGELVQEGRFTLNGHAEAGEARLSILPTLRGEKAVIRLLAGGAALRPLATLGYPEPLQAALQAALDQPQGLLLAVGPSGSGKSTTLYALLHDLAARAGGPLSLLTIEDPVEQSLPDAAQISVDPARGLDFAAALRAVLRQDAEVIMIGEVRDAETAGAAFQAALTGHRLLSSMHTLSAAEALVRLRQMGLPAYVIASALAGVLSTRLARRLCPQCRRPHTLESTELALLPEATPRNGHAAAPWTTHEPEGCEACLGSGYHGRMALGEWTTPGPVTAAALEANAPRERLAETLVVQQSARRTAIDLLRNGTLSLDDFRRHLSLLAAVSLPAMEPHAPASAHQAGTGQEAHSC